MNHFNRELRDLVGVGQCSRRDKSVYFITVATSPRVWFAVLRIFETPPPLERLVSTVSAIVNILSVFPQRILSLRSLFFRAQHTEYPLIKSIVNRTTSPCIDGNETRWVC